MESEFIQNTQNVALPVRPKKTGLLLIGLFLVFSLVSAYVIIQQTRTTQHIASQAAAGTATLSVLPQSVSLPPDVAMQIWITADKPVAFVETTVSFDLTKLVVSKDPVLSTDKLSRVILQTSRADANANGTYTFVLGLDPTKRNTPPTGTFQLATLTFSRKTNTPNTQTSVSVDTANTSVVDTSAIPFNVIGNSSSVTINPISPSPSPTSHPSSTPGPTSSPTPNSSPTQTPTLAPGQPTSTPKINPSDLNNNGTVDIVDYTLFMQYWDEKNVTKGDFNRDGIISVIDYTLFMNGWNDYLNNK